MARIDDEVEFQNDYEMPDDWNVLSFLQDNESCDKATIGNNMAPIFETATIDPSRSSTPNFTLSADHPHTALFTAQAVEGNTSNVTASLGQEHMVDDAEVKTPAEPVSQPKRSIARSNDKSAKPKRVRGPNWSEEEKNALLVLKLEALTRGPVIKCAGWSNDVSKNLLEKYGFDRNSKSCQQQWDTLLKDYKSIKKFHESTHSGISFWKMDEHQRSKSNEKFPQVFYKAWYVLMESIIEAEKAAKKTCSVKGTASIKGTATSIEVDANLPSPSIQVPSTTITINSADLIQLGQASDANYILSGPSQDQLVSTIVSTAAQFSNLATTDQSSQGHEDVVLDVSLRSTSQGNLQQSEDAEVSNMSNDDLISRIAPFVNKLIEDKLRHVLQSRQEEEQTYREKMLAIEKEKLALMHEKHNMLSTHHGATIMGSFASTSAYNQVVAPLNLASTSLAGQEDHIADDGSHGEVNLMQHYLRIS